MRKNIRASLVNLTLNMRYKNDKNIKLVVTRFVFQAQNAPKSVFGRGGAGGLPVVSSLGGAYDALPDPLVGWRWGCPLPIPVPLDAFGASVLRPPQRKFLATPVL